MLEDILEYPLTRPKMVLTINPMSALVNVISTTVISVVPKEFNHWYSISGTNNW